MSVPETARSRAMPALGRWRRLRASRAWPWLRDLAVAAVLVFALRTYQQQGLASGAAPELSATDVQGKPVALQDFRGAPVMLHFWATWCGVCRAEQSNLDALARDLPIVSVASRSGDAARIESYLRRHGITLPVIPDPSGALAQRFGVRAFPTTFVLDARGRIRHAEVGYTTALGLRARMWLADF